MHYETESLRCPNCDAPLDIDWPVHDGDMLVCEYCASTIRLREDGRRSARGSRRISLTVIDNSFHDHSRHLTQEYNFYGGQTIALDGTYGRSIDARRRNVAWKRRECDRTRRRRQREKEARHQFGMTASKILCVILPIVFIVALTHPDAEVAGTCFVTGGIGAIVLLALIGGAFELKEADAELAPDETRAPLSSEKAQGMPYKEVVEAFEAAGFEDVRPSAMRDLGFMRRLFCSSEGRVAEVHIADKSDFGKGAIFRKDAVVYIRYHSAKSFWG